MVDSKIITLNLAELITEAGTDSISGRSFGEGYAIKQKLLENINKGFVYHVVINKEVIKAINDSFWKGFFSGVFEKYKTKDTVKSYFSFDADPAFIKHIDKNLTILDSIYNV